MNVAVNEAGYERDRLGDLRGCIRWWVYVEIPGGQGRNQLARRGVIDRGWRFARGGRAMLADEARDRIQAAYEEARAEFAYWQHQPSHMLGPAGELIPLDEIPLELQP